MMKENSATRYRLTIASVLFPLRVCTTILGAVSGPLLPLIMNEFNISYGTASWFGAVPQILFVLFAVPSGILASRIGLKRAFAIGNFFLAAGIVAPFCSTYSMLLLSRIFFGIGVAMAFPLAGGIIAQWFNPREIPLVNGFNQASGSIGQAISFFITVPVAGIFSWRGTLVGYSAAVLIMAFLWLAMGKDKPAIPEIIVTNLPARDSDGDSMAHPAKLTSWQIIKRRETLFLGVAMLGPFGLYSTFSSWLPTYYYRVFNMPPENASAVSAIFLLAGIPASIIGGILPARLGFRKPIIVVSGLMLGLVAVTCFLFNSPFVIFPALIFYGFFAVVYMPAVFTLPMELSGMTPQGGSIALSFALAAGNLGGFICPVIVGYLVDFTGSYLPGFFICCGLSLSLLIGGLLLPETGPRAKKSKNVD
jgi:ACS family glucarate transporter-like MFS transporter